MFFFEKKTQKICKHCGLAGHVLSRSIHCLENPNRQQIEAVLTNNLSLQNTLEIQNTPAPLASVNQNSLPNVSNQKSNYSRTPEQIKWSNIQQKIRRGRNLTTLMSNNVFYKQKN